MTQTRKIDEVGAHALNCGCDSDKSGLPFGLLNYNSVGICIAADLRTDTLTDFQARALHDIVWGLYTVHGSRFLLHRETKQTECPAIDLHAVYEAQHLLWLSDDLFRKQNALKYTTGARRGLLERHIARLMRTLYGV